MTQPFFVTEMFTGHQGKHVPLAATIDGCEAILTGRLDNVEEGQLYMIGAIDEVKQ